MRIPESFLRLIKCIVFGAFLTCGASALGAVNGVFLASPTLAIQAPADNSHVTPGLILVTGYVLVDRPETSPGVILQNSIVGLAIGGRSVDSIDPAGNFAFIFNIQPGRNTIVVTATDAYHQTTTNSIVVFGDTCPSSLVPVGAGISPLYGRTTFNKRTKILYADAAIQNNGSFSLHAPLLLGVIHISDPTVRLLAADGISSDGIPYYDFSDTLNAGLLEAGAASGFRALAFHNPNQVRFSYDLIVLGQPNHPPAFTSAPILQAVAGKPYEYGVHATDPDGDRITYSMVTGPDGMSINPANGLLSWTPGTSNVGNFNISLRASDDFGGSADQRYVLSVVASPPNQPPSFISTPVTVAYAGATYQYSAQAVDPDGDPITYSLQISPDGMTIDPAAGLIRWDLGGDLAKVWPGGATNVALNKPASQSSVNPSFGLTADKAVNGDTDDGTITGRDTNPWLQVDLGLVYPLDHAELWHPADCCGEYNSGFFLLVSDAPFPTQSLAATNAPGVSTYFQPADSSRPTTIQIHRSARYVRVQLPTTDYLQVAELKVFSRAFPESDAVTVAASDTRGGMTSQSYVLTVLPSPSNSPPIIVSQPPAFAIAGQTNRYDVIAIDPDNDRLTYSLPVAPAGATIDPASGLLLWSVPANSTGTRTFIADVTDGRGGYAEQQFDVSIESGGGISGIVFSDVIDCTKRYTRPTSNSTPTITLSKQAAGVSYATGIAYHEPSHSLIYIGDYPGYPTERPYVFHKLTPAGSVEPLITFTNLALTEEVKISTVQSCDPGGFNVGDIFFNNGQPGQIARLSSDTSTFINPWVTLPADGPEAQRIPTCFDRAGVFGGDLIVAIGRALVNGSYVSTVWRVNSAGIPTQVASLATNGFIEALLTVPNDPARYGPMAGKILLAMEEQSTLYAIGTNGTVTPFDLGLEDMENLVLVPADANLYLLNWEHSLDPDYSPAYLFGAPASDLRSMVGDILVAQELRTTNQVPDLYRLFWDGSNLRTEKLVANVGLEQAYAFEQAVFAPVGISNLPPPGPLTGWTVYLDTNQNGQRDPGEPFNTTGADGSYQFSVAPGTYAVAEETQPGWVQIFPSSPRYLVTITNGQNLIQLDFGNRNAPVPPDKPPGFTTSPPTNAYPQVALKYRAIAVDPDGDSLTFDLPLHPDGMTIGATSGALVWIPTLAQIGAHDVILRVQDGRGGVALQSFRITVTTANTAPIITSIPHQPAYVGVPYEYQVHAQDAESEDLTYNLASGPSGMDLDGNTGLLSWTPITSQIGTQAVQVIVADEGGLTATQSFSLVVVPAGTNQSPFFTSTPPTSIRLGRTYRYVVTASDPDGDALSFDLTNAPAGMIISSFPKPLPQSDTHAWAALVAWSPSPGQFGSNQVAIHVSDGRGGETAQDFVLNVVGQSIIQPPEIVSAPILFGVVGRIYAYDLRASDPAGYPILWSFITAPAGMSLDPDLGTIRWMPTLDQLGTNRVSVFATDGQGGVASQTFDVLVTAQPLPPMITSVPPLTAGFNKLYTYAVRAFDPQDGQLTFSLGVAPTYMMIDPTNGLVRWTPTAAQLGSNSVTINVQSDQGTSASQSYSILVSNTLPHPPLITSSPNLFAAADFDYFYTVTAFHPDGLSLSFQLLASPDGMSIDSAQGIISWMPSLAEVGTQAVSVAAIDSLGLRAVQSFSVRVFNANEPPVITSSPPFDAFPGLLYAYDVQVSLPNGGPATFALSTNPRGMIIDDHGRVTWLPGTADVGTNRISIRVTDILGGIATQTYDLVVHPYQPAPLVSLELIPSARVPLGTQVILLAGASDGIPVQSLGVTFDRMPVVLDAKGRTTLQADTVGAFSIVATAVDAAGNIGTASTNLLVFDPNLANPPMVAITSPADNESITHRVDVIGTVSDANLLFYSLAVAPVAGGDFTEIAHGTSPVNNDVLGKFDPTMLLNDSYVLQLLAVNSAGATGIVQVVVHLNGELKVGNFKLSFVDLSIPVSGIPITVARTYDTLNAGSSGDFGYGWRLEFREAQVRSSVAPSGLEGELIFNPFYQGAKVYVTLPGGRRERFTFHALGNVLGLYYPYFTGDAGVFSTLTSPQWTLVQDGGNLYEFTTGIPYNPADPDLGQSYNLTTKDGISYNIDALSGLVTSVSDLNHNTLTFNRDGIFSSAGPKVLFGRDPQGRITSVTDPMGHAILYQYDSNGDLTAVTDRMTNTTQFVYLQKPAHYLQDIIDPLGRRGVRTDYDENGRLVGLTDAKSNIVQLVHDIDSSVERVIDQLGYTNTYVYDERGNVIMEVNAIGAITQRAYDSNNNMTHEVDPLGHTNLYEYDSQGNVTKHTDPLGNANSTTYGSNSRILSVTDSLGSATRTEYDSRGNPSAIIDAAGNTTRIEADANGNPSSIIDPLGAVTGFRRDSAGNLLHQTNALGNVTSFTYDANGKQLSQTSLLTVRPGFVRTNTTYTTYDASGRPTSTTDPAGNVSRTEYDNLGKTKATIDALGHRIEFHYDEVGRPTNTVFSDGTMSTIAYDAAGRRTSSTDRGGHTTHFEYDVVGQLITTIHPDETPDDLSDNPRNHIEHDVVGRAIVEVDERTNRTAFAFDAAGRQIALTNALGYVTLTGYDSAGRRISLVDPLGRTTRFIYDELGRQVETIFADDTSQRTIFDAVGRALAQVDRAGNTNRFQYNPLGQLTNVVDALCHNTSYDYDEAGHLVQQQDANGHVTRYEYETCCQHSAVILPLGQRSTTVFNAVNAVAAITNFNEQVIRYDYDVNNRLSVKALPDNGAVYYGYTATGRRATITNSAGVTIWTYDVRDRIVRRTDPDGRYVGYEYDAAGNRTATITKTGTNRFTFDALNRLGSVIDPDGGVTRYSYDAVDNLVLITLPNGTLRTNVYDAFNHLTNIAHFGPTGLFASSSWTLGATGQRLRVREVSVFNDQLSTIQRRYSYDSLQRLTREEISGDLNLTNDYVMDAVGNRLYRTNSFEGVSAYTYDENDQLLSDSIANSEPISIRNYFYDSNGNMLSRSNGNESTSFAWSTENRLIAAVFRTNSQTSTQKAISYSYDDDGIRVGATITAADATNSTAYVIDGNRPYAQVMEEWISQNSQPALLAVSYAHGRQIVSQSRGSVRSYFHADALGSTVAVTSQNGQVTDRYSYDAYGRLVAQAGTTAVSHLFAGEERTLGLDLDYLRARYLSTELGRLYGADPEAGSQERPLTRHRFIYANDDPINHVDPSGREVSISEIIVVLAVVEVLTAISQATGVSSLLNCMNRFGDNSGERFSLQPPGSGVGPIIEREFTSGWIWGGRKASDIIRAAKRDINRFSTDPSIAAYVELYDTPFRFVGGPSPNEINLGNVYQINGPGFINPYVRTTMASPTSFGFTTLKCHPEAGQVTFSAEDLGEEASRFTIRVRGHPSGLANAALYYSITGLGFSGYETQGRIWRHFVENVRGYATQYQWESYNIRAWQGD